MLEIYGPPSSSFSEFITELDTPLITINGLNCTAYIIGDFNFDLLKFPANHSTLVFINTLLTYGSYYALNFVLNSIPKY